MKPTRGLFSRRTLIGSFAAISTALGGRILGFFPEVQYAHAVQTATASGVRLESPPTISDIVTVEFDQAELARRFGAVAADPEVRALRARASQEGLHVDIASAFGATGHLRQAPQLAGYVVVAPMRRADGVIAGRLIFGRTAEGARKVSLGLERGTGVYDVYRGFDGRASRESTITKTDSTITFDFADGTSKSIPIPVRSSGGRAGLAAPRASCGLDCLSCNLVCSVVLTVDCWVATEFVCIAITPECPLCGLACSVIFVVLCAVFATWNCFNVCSSCC